MAKFLRLQPGTKLSGLNLTTKPFFHVWCTRSLALNMAPRPEGFYEGLILYDHPLLEISPRPFLAIDTQTNGFIATSRNGLLGLKPSLELIKLPFFCVGEATASAAREMGFGNLIISQGNGLDLIDLVEKSIPRGAHLTVRRGHIQAHNYADILRSYGYFIDDQCVYETKPIKTLPTPPIGGFQSVWVYSRKGAETLLSLPLERLLHEYAHFIAISDQVADALIVALKLSHSAFTMKWSIYAAKTPSEAGILTIQTSLLP